MNSRFRYFFVRLWVGPITAIGLSLAVLIWLRGGTLQKHAGVWEASGGCAETILWLLNPFARIEAITLGHVILARNLTTADRLRAHEHVHVKQYERWGVLFPVAYLAASLMAVMRGECAYRGNVFEREAFESGQNTGRD